MTFKDLQNDLIAEVEKILSGMVTVNADGEEAAGLTGYAHNLPLAVGSDGDGEEYFPFFIVRFTGGSTEDDDDWWHVATDIIIGIHDKEYSGGLDHVLVAIQRIMDRFAQEPLLNKRYRAEQDMEWALNDDETYPYYFGGVTIKFSVPKIGRKEGYYG